MCSVQSGLRPDTSPYNGALRASNDLAHSFAYSRADSESKRVSHHCTDTAPNFVGAPMVSELGSHYHADSAAHQRHACAE